MYESKLIQVDYEFNMRASTMVISTNKLFYRSKMQNNWDIYYVHDVKKGNLQLSLNSIMNRNNKNFHYSALWN